MTSSDSIRQTGLASAGAGPLGSVDGFVSRPPGVLRFRGKDSIEFLNRMSTNELVKLKEGDARTTILTTEKGRIIDVVSLLVDDGSVLMMTGIGRNGAIKTWLEKFIIMEDIAIADETSVYARYSMTVVGDARALLPFFSAGMAPDISVSRFARVSVQQRTAYASMDELWPSPVYSLLIPDDGVNVAQALAAKLREISTESYSTLEIEMGVPAVDAEIRADVNPLELGLERFISGTKGCYIGQEVVARIDTYQKLRRRLTGFVLQPTAIPLSPKGKVLVDGTEVGEYTRHAYSQRLGKHIALGFLDTGYAGLPLTLIGDNSAAQIPALSLDLPFTHV